MAEFQATLDSVEFPTRALNYMGALGRTHGRSGFDSLRGLMKSLAWCVRSRIFTKGLVGGPRTAVCRPLLVQFLRVSRKVAGRGRKHGRK